MAGLRAAPPTELGGQPVLDVTDLGGGGAAAAVGCAHLPALGSAVVVRPSGTEPKLKCYLEVVEPVTEAGLATARRRAAARMAPLRAAAAALLGRAG